MTEDGPLNQDIPKIPMEIVEDRSAQQEEDPGAPAFTATATRYVPRPLGHELQRAHVFMHPLAAEQSIVTMEVNAAPATHLTSPSQPTPTPETTAALMHTIQPPIQFPSPVMAQSGSVPEPTSTPPQFQTSLSRDQVPMVRKRLAESNTSRGTVMRKNTGVQPPRMRPREAATEKTCLIEQLDLTTRKIIKEKDEQIAKLQAQVDNYKTTLTIQEIAKSAWRCPMASGAEEKAAHVEVEMSNATLHNTSQCDSHIPADVNQVEMPSNNTNNHTELTQAPLAFKGQDINMGGQPNEEPAQVLQAVEDEDVDMGVQTEERHVEARREKYHEGPLSEDEDIFGGMTIVETRMKMLETKMMKTQGKRCMAMANLQFQNPFSIFKGPAGALVLITNRSSDVLYRQSDPESTPECFSNLKREWKKWQPKEGEDKTAVNHCNSETTRVTLKSKRRNARRKHLKHLRVAITDGNQIKTNGTKDDVWYFLWLVATELGIGGMSSNESSPDTGRKYVIKSVPWCSEELTPYLQMIDNDFNRYNRYGNCKPGNPFRDRVRLPGAKASTRPAIRGLPRNFYDKTWYANLTSEAKAFLQERPELPFPVVVTYNN
ncbi:hypothetical protein CPB84DRAFT_1855410 [Gymnopilus junonius]|uniref:Uncharacterized protein n=1 Tax=Gymnopilus junonius TaxID=109634 RepID=A0A9P5N770_GYMJU|nr:hypothetical protein CPB84DRAFT_1855410 [Gymnopilus junonius]